MKKETKKVAGKKKDLFKVEELEVRFEMSAWGGGGTTVNEGCDSPQQPAEQ